MEKTNHNLYFNIIHFDWDTKPQKLYFSLEEDSREKRIHKSSFPSELQQIFSKEQLTSIDNVYTSFGYPKEGYTAVEIDIKATNPDFAKHYFKNKLKIGSGYHTGLYYF